MKDNMKDNEDFFTYTVKQNLELTEVVRPLIESRFAPGPARLDDLARQIMDQVETQEPQDEPAVMIDG